MNKRGQMFVVIAFIICFILFTVITPYNTVRETVALQDFDELTENYKNEEPKVINKEISEGNTQDETNTAVTEFTEEFVKFAKTKDPKFGIVYVIQDAEGNYIIKNYLDEQLIEVTAKAAGRTTPRVAVSSPNEKNNGNIALEGLGEISANAEASAFDPNTNTINLGKLGGYDTIIVTIPGQPGIPFQVQDIKEGGWLVRSEDECPTRDEIGCSTKVDCNKESCN